MHPIPARVALASSVLVLGSVGTVSAVGLQAAPAPLGRIPGTPQALAPHRVAPPASPAPADLPPTPPALAAPTTPASAPGRPEPGTVVGAKDLVNLATSPLRKAVKVPVAELQRPVKRVVTRVVAKRPVTRVVREVDHDAFDRAIDDYQARAARSIGRDFGAEMARQFGGDMARRAFEGYAGAAGGYPGMGSGWADDYVGRHRAQ